MKAAKSMKAMMKLLGIAVLLGLLSLAAGCVRVKPYERELLAKPTMTFQPDPHEDVLDLHMLEAREGAVGGYGSAGGGCGCN
jgi:Domain of unknown function (DUF4266)